jgi:hypothetical protein
VTVELFANQAQTIVSSGGTTAPSPGTVESWTVATPAAFPSASNSASPPTAFHVADADLAHSGEVVAVTNVSGSTWTVTRGAEGTTPAAHAAGFTAQQVTTAGFLGAVQLPAAGDPRSFTFTAADLSDPASWYGGAAAKVLPAWTPVTSGTLVLLKPGDNGDPDYPTGFEVMLWEGATANVDYPDLTAASGSFTGTTGADVWTYGGTSGLSARYHVTAGQAYTPVLIDWDAAVVMGWTAATVLLDGLYSGLAPFGGLAFLPPPPPQDALEEFYVAVNPGQTAEVYGFAPVVNRATGYGAVALGLSASAAGGEAAAFGRASAPGFASLAAGDQDTQASGDYSAAVGSANVASGTNSTALGWQGTASGHMAVTLGYHARAARTCEEALSGGFLSNSTHVPVQVCRLVMGAQTTDATPAYPGMGRQGGATFEFFAFTDDVTSLVKAWVVAADTAGAACSAWEVDAVVTSTGGTPRLVGSATVALVAQDSGASSWGVAFAAANASPVTSAGGPVQVTGDVSATVNWTVVMQVTEVPNA